MKILLNYQLIKCKQSGLSIFHHNSLRFSGAKKDKFESPLVSGLKETTFLNSDDINFVYDFCATSKKISPEFVLQVALALNKEKSLKAEHKKNLFEHMLLKQEQDNGRNLQKLLSSIAIFSKNKKFSSMLISDSSKYLLENPSIDAKKYYDIVSEVVKKRQKKEIHADLLKLSKILYKRNDLVEYLNKDYSYAQILFLNHFNSKLLKKMRKINKFAELKLDEQFVLLKACYKTNGSIFNDKFKKLFPMFHVNKDEFNRFVKDIQAAITKKRPLVINCSKSDVKQFAKTLFADNPSPKGTNLQKFYDNLSVQIMFEPFKNAISTDKRTEISKLIKAYSYIVSNDRVGLYKVALMVLVNKNLYDNLSCISDDKNFKSKLESIKNILNDISGKKYSLKQDTFDDIDKKFIIEKHFLDGTHNKIIDCNQTPFGNPNVFLHSSSINVTQVLPLHNQSDGKSSSECIFSATYLNNSNIINPFRKFGVILRVDDKNILGGSEHDLATGYDKNIENFAEIFFSEKYKPVRDFLKIKSMQCGENDISDNISSTKRIDGRRYNEFLLLSPKIVGVYGYVNDISEFPYEYRKFAQDNDLYLIKLKNEGVKNANHKC